MFERFTKDARESVVEAQQVARQAGADHVGAEHVLLGTVADPASVAARALRTLGVDAPALAVAVRTHAPDDLDAGALAALGIDLDAVRSQAEATFGAGALDGRGAGPRGHLPFTAAAKKLLELSLREAVRLRSNRIDTGHLLLAATRLDGTAAQRALADLGADRAALEQAVTAAWASPGTS